MMEMRQLQYFVTVVECATFTKAAEALHISQPSLSAAIKKLEREIGYVLLDRTTREHNLTKEGEIVYLEAKKLMYHHAYVENELKRLRHEGPPELTIGVIESVKHWIPKILIELKKAHPNVKIRLFELLSQREVMNALTTFGIDVAITNQYFQLDEILISPIYEEKLNVVLPPWHFLSKVKRITLQDIKGEEFILCREGFQSRKDVLAAFEKSGIRPNIQYEIERFETACSLVENGLGITILPENYLKNAKNNSCISKEIHDKDLSRKVYVAVMNNRYLPPVVRHFLDLLKNLF